MNNPTPTSEAVLSDAEITALRSEFGWAKETIRAIEAKVREKLAAQEPVAWRHSKTLTLHETPEDVQLADGDEWAEPLFAAPVAGGQAGMVPWRCFHCDEAFTTSEAAQEHFGKSEYQQPGCQIDIAEYRRMEELSRRYCEEDTDLHREIFKVRVDGEMAAIRAEEAGYARGLEDAKKHPEELGLRALEAVAQPTEGQGEAQRLAKCCDLLETYEFDDKFRLRDATAWGEIRAAVKMLGAVINASPIAQRRLTDSDIAGLIQDENGKYRSAFELARAVESLITATPTEGAAEPHRPEDYDVTQGQYDANILNGVANWLETRSATEWAKRFGYVGLMKNWAVDLRAVLPRHATATDEAGGDVAKDAEAALRFLAGLHPELTIDGPPMAVAERIWDSVMADRQASADQIKNMERNLEGMRRHLGLASAAPSVAKDGAA